MTRFEATQTICEVINSGIISDELEERLQDVVNCICDDSFEECSDKEFDSCYCDGCKFLKEE